MKAWRRSISCLCWATLAAAAPAASAPAWDPAAALRLPGWAWAGPQQYELPGAHVSLQRFRTRVPPAEAARQLSAAAGGRLARLQFNGAVLLLSGSEHDAHWLAELRAAGKGSVGLVSRLAPAAVRAASFDPGRLAPAGARRVLQVTERGPGDPASLSSYACDGTVAQVGAAVRQALREAGWMPADGHVDPQARRAPAAGQSPESFSEWLHARQGRLSLHLHARAGAVALTFWHRPKESP